MTTNSLSVITQSIELFLGDSYMIVIYMNLLNKITVRYSYEFVFKT
jgi:hypothetical protein